MRLKFNLFDRVEYYTDNLPEFYNYDRKLNRAGIILISLLCLFHIYSDYKFFNLQSTFFYLLTLRIIYFFISACILLIIRKMNDLKQVNKYSKILFFWALVTIAFVFIIDCSRPKEYILGISMDSLLILSVFVIFRLNLSLQIIIASLFSLSVFIQIFSIKNLPNSQSYFTIISSLIFIFVMGIIFSKQIKRYRLTIISKSKFDKTINDELKILAFTDHLSALFNRRKIFEILDDEFSRYKRYNTPASIIIFDIDHFKKINDTNGHDLGDRVIIEVSSILRSEIRQSDYVGRTGGDEFLIILPHSGIHEAVKLAERIKNKFNKDIRISEAVTINLSGSMGIAKISDEDITSSSWYERADKNLYTVKETGRNNYKY